MIIKGNRGASAPETERTSSPEPTPRTGSAIVKGHPADPPPGPVLVRRSAIVKREVFSLRSTVAGDEEASGDGPAAESWPAEAEHPLRQVGPTRLPAAEALPVVEAAPNVPAAPSEQQILEEANRRAEAILRQAQMEARRLVEESKTYCQQALQEAEKAGLELGRERGYQEARSETIEHVLGARTMFVEAVGARERLLRSLQPEVARLALKVAERIMSTSLTLDPEVIHGLVTSALERVKDREHIKVLVHAEDVAVVRANRDVFVKLLDGQKSFEILADAKVDRGGCIIESNQGNVDARVQTQLGALRLAFEEIERREREEIAAAAEAAALEAQSLLEAQSPLQASVLQEAPTYEPSQDPSWDPAAGGGESFG